MALLLLLNNLIPLNHPLYIHLRPLFLHQFTKSSNIVVFSLNYFPTYLIVQIFYSLVIKSILLIDLMDPTQSKTTSGAGHSSTHKPNSHPKPSKSELMSSAKLVADAAKAKIHHDPKKYETSELAGAAADLLNAASQYGKLEETGIGKFVGKAETYLHKYETSHSTTATTAAAAATTGHTHSSGHTAGKHEEYGSGYGEYIKMAEGIFQKHSDGSQSSESGKKGEYLKMAGDFLKKH